MVDLKKLEKMLDETLAKETKESLNKWLDNQRTRLSYIDYSTNSY